MKSIFDIIDPFRRSDRTTTDDLPILDEEMEEFADDIPEYLPDPTEDPVLPAAPAECPLCDDEGLCTYHNERTPQYDDQGRCRTCRGTGETIRISHGREGFVSCPDCGGRGWV